MYIKYYVAKIGYQVYGVQLQILSQLLTASCATDLTIGLLTYSRANRELFCRAVMCMLVVRTR